MPFPPASPMGKMDSGLMTLSKFPSEETTRYQLPGQYSWPTRIFHLKRCVLFTRIPSAVAGKDWCLFNIHLSAYGDGSMRREQLTYLKALISSLYDEGHYVVAGGDWNSLFPGVEKEHFGAYTTPEEHLGWIQRIPEDWTMEGWQWCYDPKVSTSRSLEKPYLRGENFETIIDGFYVSPNIEVRAVRGYDLMFEHSDHNPVSVTLRAK
ncbi:MAG: hypothetical protein JEY99_19230 [Spirochaetales bacterium]|nr:hypothetical protein [Spirochaetales bacterium]